MIKLFEIIEDLALEEERLDSAKKEFYLHYAINGYRDLHQDLTGVTKRLKQPVDSSNNTADLPEDFQRILDIYAYDSSGRLVGLGQDRKIFKDSDACGNAINPSTGTYGGIFLGTPSSSRHFVNGQSKGAFYGLGGQQIDGNYRINMDAGRIEFSTSVTLDNVIIEYLGDVEQINGEFFVHEYFREPIKNWIRWTKSKNDPNLAEYWKREYYRSKRLCRAKMSTPSIEQMRQAARSGTSQAPKQ